MFICFRRVATAMLCSSSVSLFAANPNNVRVGAIRWDAWVGNGGDTVSNTGGQVEGTLGPRHWHYRLPFYAKITGPGTVSIEADNASAFEEELANFAGVSDWVGTLKRLRIDPEQGASSGTFSIDSIQVKDTAPSSDYAAFNLSGCWLLDEANGALRAADASGKGGVGYPNGGVTWGAGRIGNAATFDGVNDDLTVHDSAFLDGMSAGLTVASWIWITGYTAQTSVPIGKDVAGGSYRITLSSDGVAAIAIPTQENAWYSVGTTLGFGSALAAGQWHHLAATYDGTRLRTYVNGALVNTATATISGSIVNSTSEVRLGFKSASNIDWFNGKLDEVVIARRALTASEISQLYFATQ
jgi:hypothetical protein